MQPNSVVIGPRFSVAQDHASTITLVIAAVCLVWYITVVIVCSIGWRYYSRSPCTAEPDGSTPHVTIIRPIKGLEPCLYECLASTFRQQYPKHKLHVRFCLASRDEPSLSILERLLKDFPDHDARILTEDEDVALRDNVGMGPNPKIRNMSRAYREAVGDMIWIIDCNVWVTKGACLRMTRKLHGEGTKHPNKFVHLLPLVVDTIGSPLNSDARDCVNGSHDYAERVRTVSTATAQTLRSQDRSIWSIGGGRLEELFMSSSHAKFYTAINTVLIAPCIVGKSTMFRRSHLDSLTENQGIDTFSRNICEDHLIGDVLWKRHVPEEKQGVVLGKHALCFGDLAIQPMANMSVREYWSRRVRWLRVRKFTVLLATLVEPGTESFLCSLYGAFAVITLPAFYDKHAILYARISFALFWLLSVSIWCIMDWTLYQKLHSAASIEVDENTPTFARPPDGGTRRPFWAWLLAWLGRETLALPIWLWAFYGGTRVEWRGRKFWVGTDMKVHEILDSPSEGVKSMNGYGKSHKD